MGCSWFFKKKTINNNMFYWKEQRDKLEKLREEIKTVTNESVCGIKITNFDQGMFREPRIDNGNKFIDIFVKSEMILGESRSFLDRVEAEAEVEAKKLLGIE